MDEEAITIKLTRDQPFVLSDWLYQVMFQSDDLVGATAAMHRAVSAEQLHTKDNEAIRSLERFIVFASGDVQ
ncbi:hypothetical protein [Streptomyces phaeochromogenes]|uniref:hypothetical protein n=1 Tax=Streptomyces phaeochromogenes TaxID=1923 RepID=UPI00371C70CF